MTPADSLGGATATVHDVEQHVDERAVAPPLVALEAAQGTVFESGPADFDALDPALNR